MVIKTIFHWVDFLICLYVPKNVSARKVSTRIRENHRRKKSSLTNFTQES